MDIEAKLVAAAKRQIEIRYPRGWGGAASVRLDDGTILTSVAPDVENDALSLCMEVGALLEANRLELKVTHSLCLYRKSDQSEFIVLTPCGICQERLIHWGSSVKVAVSNPENKIRFVELSTLMPHHWSQVNGLPASTCNNPKSIDP